MALFSVNVQERHPLTRAHRALPQHLEQLAQEERVFQHTNPWQHQ